MREYKFRAWDRYHQEMINWKQYKGEMVSNDFEDDDLTIMQWTGLKDRVGVEIYEGDIIEFVGWDGVSRGLYRVMYMQGDSSFAGYAPGKYLSLNNSEQGVRVVGNIFENPELIKGANNG